MAIIQIVHCSGYSLSENLNLEVSDRGGKPVRGKYGDWHYVMWGDAQKQLVGRIPMALWTARVLRAKHILWSTGCTRLGDGIWEAEHCYAVAEDSYTQLFKHFPNRFPRGMLWASERSYREWLHRTAVFDTESHNTMTSLEEAMLILKKLVRRDKAFIHCVSSSNHVPRVLRDAIVAFNLDGSGSVTLSAVPAETTYGGKPASATIVRDLGD